MMTTEEAWRHVLAQVQPEDEARTVLDKAVFENIASIAKSLDRIAAAVENPQAIYNAIVEGLWNARRNP